MTWIKSTLEAGRVAAGTDTRMSTRMVVLLLLFAYSNTTSSAWVPPNRHPTSLTISSPGSSSSSSSTLLLLSDIPRDDTNTKPNTNTKRNPNPQTQTQTQTPRGPLPDNKRNKNNNNDDNEEEKTDVLLTIKDSIKSWMPPPPEDQFIMTGDIGVLFLYTFTSHFLNNMLVDSVISNSDSIQEALTTLDPMSKVTTLQHPVWLDATRQPQVVENVLTWNAQSHLLNHWGPLYSSAGSACVALCSCWLLAGWWHRAFLFQNSLECDTPHALLKTLQTWMTMVGLMILLTIGVHQTMAVMALHYGSAVTTATATTTATGAASFQEEYEYLFTHADTMFLVDSMSVLIAWRYTANSMMKYFM